MKKSSAKLIGFAILAFVVSLTLGYDKVNAAQAKKNTPKLYYSVFRYSDWATISRQNGVEGILTIQDGGKTHYVFCLDYMNAFPENRTDLISTSDIVAALSKYGFCDLKWTQSGKCNYLSKDQSEALLKKITLYIEYLKQAYANGEINGYQFIFYGQGTVWTLVSGAYYGSMEPQITYMVDTDDAHSSKYFGISNQASLNLQKTLWNRATAYYNEKKGSMSGVAGKIWYVNKGANFNYNSKTTWQPMLDIGELEVPSCDPPCDSDNPHSYNYSLDVACTNCDSTISDNKAYVIQDTNDWEAILASMSADDVNRCPQIPSNYYYKGDDVYCRDEFYVYLPNKNNIVSVSNGRYFTLNEESNNAEIPNLKPVEVRRVRQCRSINGRATLNNYANDDYLKKFTDYSVGDVYLKYNEDMYGLEKTKLAKHEKENSGKYSFVDDETLQFEVTYSYTLPTTLYRFATVGSGKSVSDCGTAQCVDLGQGTLPISFNKEANNTSKVSVQFAYELPEYDANSVARTQIKDFMKGEGNYETYSDKCPTYQSVYSKYESNKSANQAEVAKSSCVKLYDGNNPNPNNLSTGAETCIEKHANSSYSCNIGGFGEGSYTCTMLGECNSAAAAAARGLEWSTVTQTCCKEGQHVNTTTGLCEDDEPNPCDTEEEARELGVDWNSCPAPKGQYCCKKDETFNEEICECQPDNPGDGPVPETFVYRVVSLEHPFVGKSGDARSTGTNWCYSTAENTLSCGGTVDNNDVVKTVFSDESVYSEDHVMYRIVLDSNAITNIREYNKENSYDDFNMECTNDGEKCTSKFLDDSSHFKESVSGNCANIVSGSNRFYTCRKAGGS